MKLAGLGDYSDPWVKEVEDNQVRHKMKRSKQLCNLRQGGRAPTDASAGTSLSRGIRNANQEAPAMKPEACLPQGDAGDEVHKN